MYTIKTVVELTGVPAGTIRAWERRYGVVSPARTDGGYRLYDDQAVRRIARMAALVGVGHSAAVAARRAASETAAGPVASVLTPPPGMAGRAIVEAGRGLDTAALSAELDRGFGSGSFEEVVDGWLMPALGDLGDAWADGRLDIAGEHFVASGVRARLLSELERSGSLAASGLGPSARMVAAQAAGVHHDLGLLAFAAVARRHGVAVTFLGADVPTPDVLAALRRCEADWLVCSPATAVDIASTAELADAVSASAPGVSVGAGGSAQHLLPEHVVRLGHSLWQAAATIASRVPAATTG